MKNRTSLWHTLDALILQSLAESTGSNRRSPSPAEPKAAARPSATVTILDHWRVQRAQEQEA